MTSRCVCVVALRNSAVLRRSQVEIWAPERPESTAVDSQDGCASAVKERALPGRGGAAHGPSQIQHSRRPQNAGYTDAQATTYGVCLSLAPTSTPLACRRRQTGDGQARKCRLRPEAASGYHCQPA